MSQLAADRDDTIGGNGIVDTQARLDIEPSFFASLLRDVPGHRRTGA